MNIFLPTIQNTGTWFLVEFFKKNKSVAGMIEVRFLEWLSGNVSISDIPPVNHKPPAAQRYFKDKINVLHSHIGMASVNPNQLSNRLFLAMCCSLPTVIPLRDPLLSILTMREKERKKKDKGNLTINQREQLQVDTWVKSVKLFSGIESMTDLFYVPIDIVRKPIDRYNLLLGLTEYCGIYGNIDYLDKESKDWKPQNTRGNYPEKKYYNQGDVEYFKRKVPVGFNLLRQNQIILRPFLERFGYKNLLWWDS